MTGLATSEETPVEDSLTAVGVIPGHRGLYVPGTGAQR